MSEEVSAKEAVESVLAHRVMTEPGFLERLVLDPETTARPIIAETIGDDGGSGLADAKIAVHLETEGTIHLVVPLADEAELAEVSGFQSFGRMALRGLKVAPPVLGAGTAAKHTDAYLCTTSGVCVCTGPDECGDEFKARTSF